MISVTMKIKELYAKGQYFTTDPFLKDTVNRLIMNNPKTILEPAVGRGNLIEYVMNKRGDSHINYDMYEIDNTIDVIESVKKYEIQFVDFLTCKIDKKYDTIIGNPPYIKQKHGNLYLKFIKKCYELLNDKGELVFIVPSEFFKLTSSVGLLTLLINNGMFTHIVHPNNDKLFNNAIIDILIFRYCKNKYLPNVTLYNDEEKIVQNVNGIINFGSNVINNNQPIEQFFDIYVGLVTGNDKIFKNNTYGNISILNSKNNINKYIHVESFPTDNDELDQYLLKHKTKLLNRKIKKFTEENWFEWGALRNHKRVLKDLGKDCIYIHNLTRKDEICFVDQVQLFSGGLMLLVPKGNFNLQNIAHYLNDDIFKQAYSYAGRFKIGHRQISNVLIDPNIL